MGTTDYIVSTDEAVIVYRVRHYITLSRVSRHASFAHVDDATAAYPHAKIVSAAYLDALRTDHVARAKAAKS